MNFFIVPTGFDQRSCIDLRRDRCMRRLWMCSSQVYVQTTSVSIHFEADQTSLIVTHSALPVNTSSPTRDDLDDELFDGLFFCALQCYVTNNVKLKQGYYPR